MKSYRNISIFYVYKRTKTYTDKMKAMTDVGG